MSTVLWMELIIAGVTIVIVSLAAWVEACVGSVNKMTIRELLDDRFSRSQESELDEAQRLRSAMLIIQMAGVVLASGLLVSVLTELYDDIGLYTGLAVAFLVLLVFGRVVPRVIAGDRSVPTSNAGLVVGRVLRTVFWPIIAPVEGITAMLSRPTQLPELEPANGEEGNGDENGDHSPGEFEPDEHQMISGILALEQVTADDIMVPRLDIVALPQNATIGEAVNVAIEAGHSRIPVYGENIDEIVGVIFAKDLLKYVTEDKADAPIDAEIRPAHFVPESKRIDVLLSELQLAKTHMAIVVDEYGGTAGVVTIEDILEEIVGEIEDEFDKEVPRIEQISENEILVDGRLLLEEVYEALDIYWDERPQGTIAGLIQRELGRIPRAGDTVDFGSLRLAVESVERRRVRRVRAERIEPTTEAEVAGSEVSAQSS
ncbi:MAG: hemolysin family protein [Chloroflexota bacterium]